MTSLDRLHQIINDAGIDDAEIMRGIEFDRAGYQELAADMGGMSIQEVTQLVHALIGHLRDDDRLQEDYFNTVNESDARYGYEPDSLGNITIRDTHTGKDVFLRGTKATEALGALKSGMGDEQAILARYMNTPVMAESAEADDSYDTEIKAVAGTYNFPWSFEGHSGFASASYGGSDDPKSMKIMSVRDQSGKEVNVDAHTEIALKKQAIAFIGEA